MGCPYCNCDKLIISGMSVEILEVKDESGKNSENSNKSKNIEYFSNKARLVFCQNKDCGRWHLLTSELELNQKEGSRGYGKIEPYYHHRKLNEVEFNLNELYSTYKEVDK